MSNLKSSNSPVTPLAAAAAHDTPDWGTLALLTQTDWESNPLGPRATWPAALRAAVDLCMRSRFPMFIWWGPSLITIYNDAHVPITGARHPQAFGKPAKEVWSDLWDAISADVDAVLQRGESIWHERAHIAIERNGQTEDAYFTYSFSPLIEAERVQGLLCVSVEETQRVLTEHQRDQVARDAHDYARTLRTWFDQAPGFVALLRGPEFVFQMVNRAYYQLVGHRPIEGLPVFEALPEVRNQGFEELLRGVYETGVPFVGRALPITLQHVPAGPLTQSFIDLTYEPMRDSEGKIFGIFAQGHNVTEQVRSAKALEEADRRKDEFLATLAHELRNPLAPIRQAATLARTPGIDGPRQKWALEVIERQAGHMAMLLDDLLDVSRISRDRLELRIEDVVLRDVINAAVEAAAPLMDRKHHTFKVETPGEPVKLLADPIRLTQVLSNLLSNAGKYTDSGGSIVLEARTDLHAKEVVIIVRDNGIGLTPESQDHVFELFSQVSSALDRAEGGLGIGLALSKGIVTLHGGRLEVNSPGLGKGSEFVIHLPWNGFEATAVKVQAAGQAAISPRRTVLLADDNIDALQTLALLLQEEGHEVAMANNGIEALAMAETLQPQVAVLDIGMPGLNGYAVAEAIRNSKWGNKIRLIALTGWGQAEDQARADAAGFDHHLTKPVEMTRVEELVALGRRA